MPYYNKLKGNENKVRTATNLLRLRNQLQKEIPSRTVRDTLLLATWNLRDFDSNRFKQGPRLLESFYYIAEIISAFDLVALQEISRDLEPLEQIIEILGPNWDYIATETTEGRSGNNERMAFVFDRNKIGFRNVVGQIILPEKWLIEGKIQFARSPFMVAFQSGWLKLNMCTVHIYYGSDSGDQLERRIQEIDERQLYLPLNDRKCFGVSHSTFRKGLPPNALSTSSLRKVTLNTWRSLTSYVTVSLDGKSSCRQTPMYLTALPIKF